jgi:hypothetical protein
MAANKIFRSGPVALTATLTTNILNPPTLTGGTGLAGTNTNTYVVLRHIRITNVTTGAVTFTLAIGATGATPSSSNSFMGFGTSIPANSYVDWYGMLRLDVADYLVGGASAATSLTFEAEGEIGVV